MGHEDRDRLKARGLAGQNARRKKDFGSKSERREVKEESPKSTDHLTIRWSFELFDSFDWRGNAKSAEATFCEIAKHLKSYSTRTWREVAQDRRRDHPIPCHQLPKKAQVRLEETKNADIDELWRFRFSNHERLWGIREDGIFYVLWWDPDHLVYPVEPKNT